MRSISEDYRNVEAELAKENEKLKAEVEELKERALRAEEEQQKKQQEIEAWSKRLLEAEGESQKRELDWALRFGEEKGKAELLWSQLAKKGADEYEIASFEFESVSN